MVNLNKGDTVRLKSGGPLMTIQELASYEPTGPKDGANFVWFDGKKKFEDVFDVAVLEISDDKIKQGRIL
ncbi:MAG: hypothetical protein JWN40_3756 [Phycisphaerales bacterium]|nr:hypothetical protein [Phycisphaerales bacterium]